MDEDLLERQENEINVLKSIYLNDLVDLTHEYHGTNKKKQQSPVNNANPPPVIRISLKPQNSESQCHLDQEQHVKIDLKVKLPVKYPNEPPNIFLENEKGLSSGLIKDLHQLVVKKANEMIGSEMIFELCSVIQEYLYNHNHPPAKSFYDQRLEQSKINLEKEQLEFFDEKKKCEDMLLAEIDLAVDLKRKMLQLERKKEKELEKRERLSSTNSPTQFRRERTHSIKSESNERDIIAKKLSTGSESPNSDSLENINFHPFLVEFNDPMQYFRIKCIKLLRYEKENSFSRFLGIDLKTDEMYTVYQWKINFARNNVFDEKKLEMCESEMHKLEEEFKKLVKLNNKLIYKYLAYKFFREANKNIYTIQICSEYLDGNTLEFLTNQQHSYAISDNALKMFAVQLLDALDYLHSNNVFHRSFKLSSVYLARNSATIKVSDYSLVKRLNDLNSIVSHDATATCQTNLKSDIHQLGIILLSLKQGEAIKSYHPQIPTNYPPELKSFFSICINENNMRQLPKFDCKSLKNHPFILKNYETTQAGTTAAVSRRRRQSSHFEDQDSEDDDNVTTFTDYPLQSRLNTEFEVIGVVGHGAFGEVLKVKNKLDSRFYAIKRIRTNPNSKVYNKQIIREIKLLSRLNHENVVRYYSTWAERYEEIYDHKRMRSHSHESSQSESDSRNTSQVIRFRKVTENHDDPYDVSTSSDDSNIGGINWVKKSSEERAFSSISGSGLDLKHPTSESEGSESEETGEASDIETDDEDIKFEDQESDESVEFEDKKEKEKKKCKKATFFIEKAKNEDTDDSVIFAEGSSSHVGRSYSSKSSASGNKEMKDSYDEEEFIEDGSNSEEEDGLDKSLKSFNSKVNRQFIYIQMEYCGGKTLKYLIEQGLYNDEEKVWVLLREILQGLNHIHEQGMIHRDLKPGNVLIDKNGHAKLADFGLATSPYLLQTDASKPTGSGEEAALLRRQSSQNFADPTNLQSLNSNFNVDSISLSGAVGTALYVAPELLIPSAKNKYFYTQKVDIYSLGVMFYEMCFPFSTNMERIHVIQDLRQREIVFNANIDQQIYQKQVQLIKEMLNHDPNKRPSAKELLLNDLIPRKADEIALDELLHTSLKNKQSTSYNKILKAVFDQKNSKVEDFSFDATNLRAPASFQYLQAREHIYNTFTSVFQNYGGYFITYPLIMPWNDLCNEFNKAFKLTDCSGTVVCLPYNHRLPFARYLARTGCTGIKRYHIGPVYQVFNEKLKLTSLHPKEHVEASFDIVTSSHDDCLPEIEILSIINDILCSFPELKDLLHSGNNFKLIVNHTSIVNSILAYCGINSGQACKIYDLLTDFNRSLIKSQDASKENRYNWFKQRLVEFDLTEQVIEKLLNFLLKTGTPENVLSELRSLTKSEATFSKLAKEGISHLKQITNNASIINFRIPITASASLTLPTISHPCQYSGFIFQLLVQKNKKKNEFDILASGGRYDKLINYFKTTENNKQCAVGVSFDFERIVTIINEKSKNLKKNYRSELTVCTISSSLNQPSSSAQSTLATTENRKSKNQDSVHSNSSQLQDIRNRIRLFKQFSQLNKRMNISTTFAHGKFQSIDEIDEYCKKYCINSYAFLKEGSSPDTSKILINNSYRSIEGPNVTPSMPTSSNSSQVPQIQFLKIRSLVEKGIRFIEKKLNLQEFLTQSNIIINNMTSYNAIHSSASTQSLNSGFGFGSSGNQSTNNPGSASTYADYISSIVSNLTTSITATPSSSSSSIQITNLNNISSTNSPNPSNNSINITILVESSNSRQQSMERGSSRKKIESQLITKISPAIAMFNAKTRIELIAMEVQDNVINCLANGLKLDMDESHFNTNWSQCLVNLNSVKNKKQICNLKLDEVLKDLRYVKKSKVFVLYNLKSDQYKLMVAM